MALGWIKNAISMVFFFLVTACVSTPAPSPLSSASVSEAVRLINSSSLRSPDTTPINDVDQRTIRVKQRLMFPIRRICNRDGGLSEKKCGKGFEFSINIDDDFNAYAHGSNNITLNSGLIRRTVTDEELAFVLAHEAGHHIANHLTEDKINSYLGELVGGVLMGAMTVGVMSALGVECDPTYEDCSWLEDIAEESVNDGMELGNEFAVARYSREQEFEADRIASDIIKDANMSIAKVIPLLAYMGNLAATGRFSEFGDSHPSGVERLAAFLDYNPESSQPSPDPAATASNLKEVKSRGVNSAASKSKDRRVDLPTAGSDSLRIKSSGYCWVSGNCWVTIIDASGKEVFSNSAYEFRGLVLTSPPLTISLGAADSITLLYGGNPLDFQHFVDKSGNADFALCPDGNLVGNISQCSELMADNNVSGDLERSAAASKSKDRRVDSPTAGSDSLRIKSSGYGRVEVMNANGKKVFSESAHKVSGLVLTSPPLTISLSEADSITLLYGSSPLDFQRFVDKSGVADFALCPDGSLVGNISQCSS